MKKDVITAVCNETNVCYKIVVAIETEGGVERIKGFFREYPSGGFAPCNKNDISFIYDYYMI